MSAIPAEFSAAGEFGGATLNLVPGLTDSDSPEPRSALGASGIGSRFYQHPGFALGVVVVLAVGAVAYVTEPSGRVSVKGRLGPVEADAQAGGGIE